MSEAGSRQDFVQRFFWGGELKQKKDNKLAIHPVGILSMSYSHPPGKKQKDCKWGRGKPKNLIVRKDN